MSEPHPEKTSQDDHEFKPEHAQDEKRKPSARRDEVRPADTHGVNIARGSETATRNASNRRG
jgi:hypothetical protein